MAQSEPSGESSERDELRTVSFRMREIQRLLAMRVTQENRRLEAEGLEPVTEPEEVAGPRQSGGREQRD